MGRVLFFIIFYLIFIFFELIPLYKAKQYRVFAAYCLIMSLGFIVQMLTLAGFSIRNVYDFIDNVKYYI